VDDGVTAGDCPLQPRKVQQVDPAVANVVPVLAERPHDMPADEAAPARDIDDHTSHDCWVRELPSGTVTMLFTDIEGSTRLLEELGPERYREALREHRRVLRDAFERHAGHEVDYEGDAFFVAFQDAAAAVGAARDAQAALDGGPVRVRMGVHTGRPLPDPPKYVGVDVHLAARIMSAGHGGQVLLSKDTADIVDSELTDLGEHRLKDFDTPIWIFQLGREAFPPLKTISNTNLPRPASSFVGREHEVAALVSMLRDGARLVTLTGPGGSGKTRLAIEAAAELVGRFRNGVFWVPLATLRDPALVVSTAGQTIGASGELAAHVGEKEMLLLLDNLEQVVAVAPELGALVETCPNLRLLVTSRELLRVRGETEYEVLPLADRDAVELFGLRSGLVVTPAAEELCRRLDNMPLALELAAARVKLLSPEQILERLGQRLDLLRGGRESDPRQATLRTTIEWSHELLSAEEQRLFRRLSVFVGGCTLDGAEQVCEADLDVFQALVEKSLVRRTGDRFWMLETIRDYAAERLLDSGEDLRRRHAEFYMALAERAEPALVGSGQAAWWENLTAEYPNVRAALEWACGGGDHAVALRLTAAMWRYWWTRGPIPEARSWYDAALRSGASEPEELRARALYGAANMALAAGDEEEAIRLLEDCLRAFRRSRDNTWIARALNDLGIAHQKGGRAEKARRYHEDAADISVRDGDMRSAAASWICVAYSFLQTGELHHAAEWLGRARSAAQEVGDEQVEGGALQNLAFVELRRGRLGPAAVFARDGLVLSRRTDDRYTLAHMLVVAAAVLTAGPHGEDAATVLGGASAMHEEMGIALDAAERDLYDETRRALRARLGDPTFEDLLARGRRLGYERAIDDAVRALA
jgi:predicted ATPase/class 3 adenylate cyclase/Flp pilus assembly protein TadD